MYIFNAHKQFRTLNTYIRENFFKNFLEAKHLQVFPLNLHYNKVSSDFFKKKSVEVFELHLKSNYVVHSTFWG